LKPPQIEALVAGYEAGKTMKELAVEFDINRLTVSGHLLRAAVQIRKGGLDDEEMVEVSHLYDAGWSSGRLAERNDVSADTVLKALRSIRRKDPPTTPRPWQPMAVGIDSRLFGFQRGVIVATRSQLGRPA
jgi:DNA-binding CsgD family transcriptional regulator